MGFRVNTNVAALNAVANTQLNSTSLDTSLERLSSGFRINSAKDDASGLAIADQLKTQASTLGQAISNGNDANSLLKTADKAMDEQIKILDAIKTKATQAAQDGQSTKTRNMLQADINRLMEELDNIANTTSFNGKQLLSGGFTNQEFQIGVSSNQTIKASIGSTQSSKIGVSRFETGQKITAAGEVTMTIKNYNGISDFKYNAVTISYSVNTGLGALAEEINRTTDKTGVRATYNVTTIGAFAIQAGNTDENFAINGVKIGRIDYQKNDKNGALISAINAVKDSTGVEASIDANGRLVMTSREGRAVYIEGSIGTGSGIAQKDYSNFGRLSLVKNNGQDVLLSFSGVGGGYGVGFSDTTLVSQTSMSLRETKGSLTNYQADALGFNADRFGVKYGASDGITGAGYFSTAYSLTDMFAANTAYTAYSTALVGETAPFVFTKAMSDTINSDTGQLRGGTISLTSIFIKQTSGVTTLKGAMAVMDVAETAILNLDQIRADIGSVQQQIDKTVNNITTTQVSLKSAESNIRDVDFASESANYSKASILAQSGSYALAQANAAQQYVMRLLQ